VGGHKKKGASKLPRGIVGEECVRGRKAAAEKGPLAVEGKKEHTNDGGGSEVVSPLHDKGAYSRVYFGSGQVSQALERCMESNLG